MRPAQSTFVIGKTFRYCKAMQLYISSYPDMTSLPMMLRWFAIDLLPLYLLYDSHTDADLAPKEADSVVRWSDVI